ncbi:MAG: P-II family nitrogen regulator [Elusimicrobiota bacterium]|jgi:nitrogen regulatory protein P-II 1|nr:P-II family nitrogen regulator [Elusimicrobiota bacterium]
MKRLEIIIRPDKLEALKNILNSRSVGGITVTSVMGCGKQKGGLTSGGPKGFKIKGVKVAGMNLLPKIQASTIVEDSVVNEILNIIHEKISSGKVGDGKVFVSPVDDAMRIRTGERGKKAL